MIFVVVILITVLGCEQKKEVEEPTTSQVKKIPDSVLDFAKKHNAIIGWDTLDIFSSVQFEELILNKKRPLLINHIMFWFHDIYKSNEAYHLLFSNISDKYYFDFECDSLQKTEILNRVKTGMFLDLIAIAEIQNVKKIDYIIDSELMEENSKSINLNLGYANSFILKGKLIDLLNN